MIDCVHPDDVVNFLPLKKSRVFKKAESFTVRYRMRKKNEDYIWLESIIKPVRKNNEVVRLICTSRNIAERK